MGKRILNHLRLFPAVIALGAILLAVKGFGLAHEARAQTLSTPPPAAAQGHATARPDPAADDPDTSSAEVDVLTSLSKRRATLDSREHELATREILIEAAEKRVDDKIASLKGLQAQIQSLLTQRDDTQQKQMAALTKTYSSMKPRDAARIFNNLNDDVQIGVAGQMKPDVLGAILGQMQADAAQKLTVRLANRTKLPEPPPTQVSMTALPAPVAAQPAAAAPSAATSAPAPATTTDKTASANDSPATTSGATPSPAK
jgi:flagellar motility protein MotE (MotC chaperone)